MDNAGFIFAAFGLIWAVVFGYVMFLANKQARINRRMDAIERARSREDRS